MGQAKKYIDGRLILWKNIIKILPAVIPVREGSTRLKNKNVAPFAGTNLLINKINQLKEVKEISRIVVSSDSDMMLAMAKERGVMNS